MADQMLAQSSRSTIQQRSARDAVPAKGRRAPSDGTTPSYQVLRDALADGFDPEDEVTDPNDHASHDCDAAGCHRIAQDTARGASGVQTPNDGGDLGSAVGGFLGGLVGGPLGAQLGSQVGGAVGNALGGGNTPAPAATPATPQGAAAGKGSSVAASFTAAREAHTPPPFGEVSWNAHEPAATYRAYVEGGVWRFRLESLALSVPVGVASGGRTDVPGANAGVVTRDTWSTIASDMTPGAGTPRRSPRTTYWSNSLTWKHELFHFAEFNSFLRTSFTSFEDTIEGSGYTEAVAASGDTEQAALARKASDLHTRLIAAWNQAKRNMSPGMEDRAYDDGVASYQALADAVRARARSEGWTH